MQRRPDLKNAVRELTQNLSDSEVMAQLPQPIIILSAPRSGSTLLFEQLAGLNPIWTIGGESHAIFHAFPRLRAENEKLDSMALGEDHVDPEITHMFRRCFLALLKNRQGTPWLSLSPQDRPQTAFFLEKTPRNALNIPFLLKIFPNARFIYLYRDPRQTISSLIEAWMVGLRTGRFVTFRDLPDWHLPGWCFVLPRGWQRLIGEPIPQIAAFQWAECQSAIMDGLGPLGPDRWACIEYDDLVRDPAGALRILGKDLDIDLDAGHLRSGALPISRTTLSRPDPQKWKQNADLIESLKPVYGDVETQWSKFLKRA